MHVWKFPKVINKLFSARARTRRLFNHHLNRELLEDLLLEHVEGPLFLCDIRCINAKHPIESVVFLVVFAFWDLKLVESSSVRVESAREQQRYRILIENLDTGGDDVLANARLRLEEFQW